MMFFLFKIFKKLENLFFEGPKDYLLKTRFGKILKKIPGLKNFYRAEHNFSNWLYYKLKPKGVTLINVQGNKMYVNTEDSVARMLLINGIMEKYTTELFKNIIKKNMVVVDVGANIGYFTLIAAKLVDGGGIVYAFEPEPNNYELLCKNIKANNYTNVVPIQKAVSNKYGKSKIWVNKADLLASSFSRKNALLFIENDIKKKDTYAIEINTTTLDGFFNKIGNKKVDFIKIDVEGAEGLVIDGAKELLKSNNLKIFLEFRPEALRNLGTDPLNLLSKLKDYGFKMSFINEKKCVLEPIKKIPDFCKKKNLKDGFNLLLQK